VATPFGNQAGRGNKSFSREGFVGELYFGKLDFQVVTQHGSDSAYFATGTAANSPLPVGARAATWNGALVETHYVYNPQLIFFQRSEWVRMAQQALPSTPSGRGNIDTYTFGYRWSPFMNNRAGFAWHNEYSWLKTTGTSQLSSTDVTSSSLMLGFDFAF